jgi:hypothetical protein
MENRGISIISSFDVNAFAPIDSRLVANNSSNRESIIYKYVGLKVYQIDVNKTYVWNGLTWSQEGNGIYGGSGSLVGDTIINMGNIGDTVGQQSYSLGFLSNPTTTTQNNTVIDKFVRWSNGNTFQGVEYRRQFFNNGSASSYISMNSQSSTLNGNIDLGFGTGNFTRRLTILSDGTGIQIWSPTYSALISVTALSVTRSYNLPDQSGTIALYDDIISTYPTLQNITQNSNTTNVGIQLIGSSFSIIATGSNKTVGHIGPGEMAVSTDYNSLSGWGVSIMATTSNVEGIALVYKQGQYRNYIKVAYMTGYNYIRFPDRSGTVALTSDTNTPVKGWRYREWTDSSNLTINEGNTYWVLSNISASATVYTPTASTLSGSTLLIESRSSNSWTITSSNNSVRGPVISGGVAGSITLASNQFVRLISDGVSWHRW